MSYQIVSYSNASTSRRSGTTCSATGFALYALEVTQEKVTRG